MVFQITERKKLDHITNLLGYDPRQNLVLHINFAMLEEECCRASFLRGIFFAGGSLTDPQKRYHLELTTSHLQASRELDVLLPPAKKAPRRKDARQHSSSSIPKLMWSTRFCRGS